MHINRLIEPLGIATYSSLLLTVITGFAIFKFHVRWVKMSWHILLGVITLMLATAHAALVLFLD